MEQNSSEKIQKEIALRQVQGDKKIILVENDVIIQ